MLFAALETSTDWCSVALWRDGGLAGIERLAPNRHAEFVLPMLEGIFERERCGYEDLDAIAFGAGPGSFTGLRVACGIAQGLAFAHALPVIGISTLEALAEESGAQRAVACLDARMREVYCSVLERSGTGWREIQPAQCVPPAGVTWPGEGWIGCGSGFAAYDIPGFPKVMAGIHPSAMAVARLAAPRLAAGQGVDAALAAPVYVRDKVALTMAEQR